MTRILLSADHQGLTPLHMSAQTDVCKFITNQLHNKNRGDINGTTPFHLAAQTGHFDVCKLLTTKILKTLMGPLLST